MAEGGRKSDIFYCASVTRAVVLNNMSTKTKQVEQNYEFNSAHLTSIFLV